MGKNRKTDEGAGHPAALRIAIIGPVPPFRGGIARHTWLLARELSKTHDVSVYSFSLQYPALLYPGRSQTEGGSDPAAIKGTRFTVNTLNPFSWFSTGLTISRSRPDLIIMPWWHPYFGPVFMSLSCLIRMLSRTKVLFIIHNVLPHERLPFDRWIAACTLKQGDFHVVQSSEGERNLCTVLKKPVYRKVLLPSERLNRQEVNRAEARRRLSLSNDAKVLLFFGFVREYKGLLYLMEALPVIRKSIPEIRLLIAGEFHHDKRNYMRKIEELGIASLVIVRDQFIPENEVEIYFSACDVVVLPYVSATQSSVVQTAYGFGKPVVVTSVGGLPEVVDHGITGYVVPPGNAVALADAVTGFFEREKVSDFSAAVAEARERFTWRRMVEAIEELVGQNRQAF